MHWVMGKGKYGQVLQEFDTSWDEFRNFLQDASQMPNDPVDKEEHFWVAPCRYKPEMIGVHRRIEDIIGFGAWIGGDLDDGHWSLSDIRCQLHTRAIVYTTASSTRDDPRWRLLIGLDREYTVAEYPRLWRWNANKFHLDERTKDCSRISYMPAQWSDESVFFAIDGPPARVDGILAMVPEIPTPTNNTQFHGALKLAPNGTDIVTSLMLDRARNAPRGGRLIKLLGQAAKRFRVNGWQLTANELAQAGQAASMIFASGRTREPGSVLREAERAIRWAETNFQPLTPLERMKQRILWERAKR